MEGNTYIICFW